MVALSISTIFLLALPLRELPPKTVPLICALPSITSMLAEASPFSEKPPYTERTLLLVMVTVFSEALLSLNLCGSVWEPALPPKTSLVLFTFFILTVLPLALPFEEIPPIISSFMVILLFSSPVMVTVLKRELPLIATHPPYTTFAVTEPFKVTVLFIAELC